MNRIQKYEKVITNLYWVFIVLLTTEFLIRRVFYFDTNLKKKDIFIIAFIISVFILNLVKIRYIKTVKTYTINAFDAFRLIEVLLISLLLTDYHFGIEYMALIFPMSIFGLYRGKLRSIFLLIISIAVKLGYTILNGISSQGNNSVPHIAENCYYIIITYTIMFAIMHVCLSWRNDNLKNEEENERLVIELEEKYEQLEAAKNEIKIQYDKLKESNLKLEDTNSRLTTSIAEFYTLQQISEAINSIFDIGELLKFVNDVILGVMGVNYSTIVIFDAKKSRLKVQFTNIRSKEDLAILNDNINCKLMMDILENQKPILENQVDPDMYEFVKSRKIGSLICIPLRSKSRKFGLILIEHKNNNTFDSENLRLLTTICKQVSMAIENAELYESLQELATIDGLTGVFNRVYFHQKYESEFRLARELGYNLSLAILDIDLFKKFNDTYGHLFGDVVLKSVAQTIKNNLRATDTIARFGGEEFIVIFPRTSLKEAHEKVESLRHYINNNVVKDNVVSASVTASFGIACYPETSTNEIELIRDADNALYKAKDSGRNCVKTADYVKIIDN